MKKNDILIIAVVVIISGVLSIVIANALFGNEKRYIKKAPKVDAISTEFKLPSDKYFNKDAINPTKDITIGDSNNENIFKQ